MEKVYQPRGVKSGALGDSDFLDFHDFPRFSWFWVISARVGIWSKQNGFFGIFLLVLYGKSIPATRGRKRGFRGFGFSNFSSDLDFRGFHDFMFSIFHLISIFHDFFNFTKSADLFWKFRKMTWTKIYFWLTRATIDLAGATVKMSSKLTGVDLFSRGKCEQMGVFSYNNALFSPFFA